jgi:hypothetical protein
LLDWDSDSTRPPSIPPRAVIPAPRIPDKLTAELTPPPPLPPKTKFAAQKANVVEDTPSVQGGSSESIYSTDLNSYSIEDGYMEDGYILPVNYRDDFNYGMGHPKQSSSYDYLTDQSNSDNESMEETNNRKATKRYTTGRSTSPYKQMTAKSTDSITPVILTHRNGQEDQYSKLDPHTKSPGLKGQDRLSQSTPSLSIDGGAMDSSARAGGPKLPSVRELKSKFLVKASPEPAPRKSISKKKLNITKPSGMNYQVHSLTARSVPNRMRETLKTGWDTQRDSIVRIQTSIQPTESIKVQGTQAPRQTNYNHGIEQNNHSTASAGHALAGKVKQVSMLYDNNRGDSPEHTGIPAHPAQLPSRRAPYSARQDGYTSDESISGKSKNYTGYTSDRSTAVTNNVISNGKYNRKIKHKVSNC